MARGDQGSGIEEGGRRRRRRGTRTFTTCMYVYSYGFIYNFVSLATPSQKEEGSGHAAAIELSPRQKLAVTNEIIDCICCHG